MFINQNFDGNNLNNVYTVQKRTVQNQSRNSYFSTDLFSQRKIIKQFLDFFLHFLQTFAMGFFCFFGLFGLINKAFRLFGHLEYPKILLYICTVNSVFR